MDRLVKVVMVFLLLFTVPFSLINLFWTDLNSIFPLSGFNQEQMSLWRLKVINPSVFLTVSYFIYRYFAGLNPTSTIWPVYVVCLFFCLSQFIGFFTGIPVSGFSISCFFISLLCLFVLRHAHEKRKREISTF